MRKIKEYSEFLNEGVRDKMTPKSEEDIKNIMGKKFNTYKSLSNAIKSIKPPYETTELSLQDLLERSLTYFEVKIRFLRFVVSYNGHLWELKYTYDKEFRNSYTSWNETWNEILNSTHKSFNQEISILKREIHRNQENVDEMEELLSQVDSINESINEGVKDQMTPKSEEDVKAAFTKYFNNARKNGSIFIDAGFYFDIWEEYAEKYRIFDNYYAYDGTIYFLYVSTNEYDESDNKYELACTNDSVENFKKTLEKGLEKLNTL